MTRAYSQAGKRRAKKALPALAGTKRRKKQGRARMEELPQEREGHAQATVLEARARQMAQAGKKPQDMKQAMFSEDEGRVLGMIYSHSDAKRMWGHYVALTTSETRYHRSLGKSLHPKGAKLEMMQERFETRADDVVDLRTEEERDRDAARSWDKWLGVIRQIGIGHASAIQSASRSFATLTLDGAPTSAGLRFAGAMRALDIVCSKT